MTIILIVFYVTKTYDLLQLVFSTPDTFLENNGVLTDCKDYRSSELGRRFMIITGIYTRVPKGWTRDLLLSQR